MSHFTVSFHNENKRDIMHTQPFYGLLGFCPGLPRWASTRKVKPIWIYWNKRQRVALASAGPYANLDLDRDT